MRLRRPLQALIALSITMIFLYIANAAAVAATTLVVTANSLNLRSGPGTSYKLVAGLQKGEKVTLLASKPGWHQIKTSQGMIGWASVSYLGITAPAQSAPSTAAAKPAPVNKVQVTGKSVNLRQTPSTSGALAGQSKQGDLLTWKKTLPGWYQVTTAAGKTAYISSTLSVLKPVTAPAAPAVPAAVAGKPGTTNKVQVTGKSVNLRQTPSTSAALAGSCKQGDLLTWQKTLTGWYQVTLANGKTAFISSSLAMLKQVPQPVPPANNTAGSGNASKPETPVTPPVAAGNDNRAGKLLVTGSQVNLRSGPATTFTVVSKVNKDQVLYAENEQDGWYEVALAGEQRAWIIGSMVKMITPLVAIDSPGTTTPPDNNPATPSRGDETRPELKAITVTSGEDYQGDFVTLAGGVGVEPTFTTEGDAIKISFPDSKLGAGGIPTRVNITEDKAIGFDLTATTRDTTLEVAVKLPAGLKNTVEQNGSRVTIRIIPQMIALAPVTAANGREVVELRATHTLTVKAANDNGQPTTRWNLTGLNLAEPVHNTDGQAYDRIELETAGIGSAEARVELHEGNLCDLVKIRSDVYRFYFRPIPKPGQPVTIMVDPGHGGSETGAIYYNTQEKKFNLAMGLKLGQTLEQAGYRVLYTRTDDSLVTLNERVAIANAERPDLYVSIHCNAMKNSPATNGTTTYYWPGDEPYLAAQRQQLAAALQKSLISRLGTTNKGVRTGEFVVVKYSTMPSALVETLFMSNREDFERLQSEDFQWQVARGVADGISNYLSGKGIDLPESSTITTGNSSPEREKVEDDQQSPLDFYMPF